MATIPPGVSSDGMTRVWFVPALADTSAPTVAEITAGFDITCYLTTDGFKVGGSQEKGEDARLCSPQVFETAGRFKPTVEPLVYVFDPQDPTNTSLANAAYKELTMGRKGYLVYRMGMAFDTAQRTPPGSPQTTTGARWRGKAGTWPKTTTSTSRSGSVSLRESP